MEFGRPLYRGSLSFNFTFSVLKLTMPLQAATLFRDHLARLEAEHAGQEFSAFFENIRCYGSACIMSAAASLEALINELFIAHGSKLRAQLKDFEGEFWGKGGIERWPILDKYQHALAMLGAPRFDERTSPYRDAWALIELRNALVHYKPTWDPERQRQTELAEVLKDRFPLSPFPDSGADFVTLKCMSAGCARWTISTVIALVGEFDAGTNLDPKKIAAFRKLGTQPFNRADSHRQAGVCPLMSNVMLLSLWEGVERKVGSNSDSGKKECFKWP